MLLFLLGAGGLFAQDGAGWYRLRCAYCHDSNVAARVPRRSDLASMSTETIVRSLTTGSMRSQGRDLSTAQKTAIARYLTGTPVNAAPVNMPRCADSPAFNASKVQWNGWGVDARNTRFQPNPGLSKDDVPRLKLKWAFGFPGDSVAFGQAAVIDGRVIAGSQGGKVYSLDARSGCVHWIFDAAASVRTAPEVDGEGTIYIGDLAANVYAVEGSSGRLKWKVNLDPHPHARITGAPKWHAGRLIVPVSSFEEGPAADPRYPCCSFRGSVVSLDAAQGKEQWRTWMIPEPARVRGKTKGGTPRLSPSGIGVWCSPTIDPRRNVLYVATGDNYTEPDTSLSDAVIAMDLDTGRIRWSKQMTAGDVWNAGCIAPGKVNCPDKEGPDFDFGASPILVDLGGGRQALFSAQKSGMVYAHDPDNGGNLLWSARAAEGGKLGGIQWGPATDGQRLYVAVSDLAWRRFESRLYRGFELDPTKGGGLKALDTGTGKLLWDAKPGVCGARQQCSPAQSGAVTAMPGAVFSGAVDGHLRAYASEDGRVLWDFDTARDYQTVNGVKAHGGSIDSAGAVVAGGMVFATSGYGLMGGMPGNVLLAFSVDGQ